MNWPHGDPDSVARSVLAEPPFAHAVASTNVAPQRPPIEIVWEWLFEHVLQRFLAPLARALTTAHGVGTAAAVVLIILALAVIGFVVARLALAFVHPRARAVRPGAGLPSAAPRSSAWRSIAAEAAARGDYARAIAALWSSALAVLDERDLVPLDPARTPGEYRRLVSQARSNAVEAFERLSERFVYATYSPAVPAAADFDVAERALAELEPAL